MFILVRHKQLCVIEKFHYNQWAWLWLCTEQAVMWNSRHMWTGCQTVSHCVFSQILSVMSVCCISIDLCIIIFLSKGTELLMFFTAAIRQTSFSNTFPYTSIHPSVSLAKGSTCYRDLFLCYRDNYYYTFIYLFIKTLLWVPGLNLRGKTNNGK